ncbi:hypothetical protein D9M68_906160 [compost metagenome]
MVAEHGTTEQADGCGHCAAAATADGVAHGATGDAADQRTGARLVAGYGHRLVLAHLARRGHLLDDGFAAEHTGAFILGLDGTGACEGDHTGEDGEEDGTVRGFHGKLLG